MSVRPHWLDSPKPLSVAGSLFGTAISTPTGGFWSRLAVSPPRTPPGVPSSRHAQLPPEFHLDGDPPTAPTATQTDSIFPSWLHRFQGATIVTFSQATPGVVTLRESPALQCTNVVSPTMIYADGAHWQRMATEASGVGHLFSLTRGEEVVCRIEVDMESDERVGKIAVVQPCFSALTVAANMAPASSLLLYDDVRGHINSLKKLRVELETSDDVGYIPTAELVCTGALDALVLSTDHSPEASVARRHWRLTKSLLQELSSATADCCDAYVDAELRRAGHCVVEAKWWRSVV